MKKSIQKQLDERLTEIRSMTDKQLVWALQAEAGWHFVAERDMRTELAENTYKDMELLKYEILARMTERNRFPSKEELTGEL